MAHVQITLIQPYCNKESTQKQKQINYIAICQNRIIPNL